MRQPTPLPRGRSGFTLIEILVSLMISALFATALFQLLRMQGGMFARNSGQEEVQQNARGALQVISGELRGVPAQGGIYSANDQSLTVLVPHAWGVACPGGTATQMEVVFPPLDGNVITRTTGSGLLADMSAGTAARNMQPNIYGATVAAITARTAFVPAADAQCATLAAGADAIGYRFTGTNFPVAPPAGNLVMLYESVTYDVGQSEGKWWVRRSYGGTQQPIAGPLEDNTTGLRFQYYTGTSATPLNAAPGRNETTDTTIHRIGVKIRMRSTATASAQYQTQRDDLTVQLRN
ncbi:MAG TPA: prepilin-type N-terminal cleavage/methylation domain-containing protein [Longimicrobiaceae bacterium]|jgi:prepilin-type N-terminal cleavage/methylation domain-containing protein|nr:prepilin-type N-terminal cleavage/methylation domain-containing protein [Longimicrobiaceae bacterium]